MTILPTPLTMDLVDQLQRSHDPGQRRLVVEPREGDILITRHDGSELSDDERFEVFARLAMLTTEPGRPPTTPRPRL